MTSDDRVLMRIYDDPKTLNCIAELLTTNIPRMGEIVVLNDKEYIVSRVEWHVSKEKFLGYNDYNFLWVFVEKVES